MILSTQDFDQQRKSRQTFVYVRVPNCPRQNGEHLPRKSVSSTSSLLAPGFLCSACPFLKIYGVETEVSEIQNQKKKQQQQQNSPPGDLRRTEQTRAPGRAGASNIL